ncbi:MAG: CmcI family methyltransferase [Candidatus Edwardsbacteria bacterium]|nr:CmcI family methyltransferase [Candidatus Edwardsbacteria bacterium]
MYTRKEFEQQRAVWARGMFRDRRLQRQALDLLVRADRRNWIHQTSWFGQPVLQLPQDLFALQEIIHRTRPSVIVEAGVAWGGSLLFYATLMESLGGRIVGIDVYIPPDLRRRLMSYGRLSRRITLIKGSSIDPAAVARVKGLVGRNRKVMVVLDSYHTHQHVLAELRAYAPLVGRGQYLVCCDTVVDRMPVQAHRARSWGPGNNPMTALRAFLAESPQFEPDRALEDKLLLTCNPGGYLRRKR